MLTARLRRRDKVHRYGLAQDNCRVGGKRPTQTLAVKFWGPAVEARALIIGPTASFRRLDRRQLTS